MTRYFVYSILGYTPCTDHQVMTGKQRQKKQNKTRERETMQTHTYYGFIHLIYPNTPNMDGRKSLQTQEENETEPRKTPSASFLLYPANFITVFITILQFSNTFDHSKLLISISNIHTHTVFI